MSDAPPFSPTIALLAVARQYESELGAALKNLNVNIRKFALLGHIDATPSVSFSQLARRSRITVQSTHTAVESLVRAGLVEDATATPGSASTLRLTEAGRELLARAKREVGTLDESLAGRFPQLVRALKESVLETR
ncbi:MarR family winged helix-turn-helix transcriptional regulator [Arthrobacter sp. 2RAF6]|uniref:MarR family winged helix-turn-helix transcriptional regulator n=1 Tax=Arthrobacter sp. 2RAF6 TaxID=3233002 RepID=UPI003F93D57E